MHIATIDDIPRIGQIHVDGWRAAYRGIVPDAILARLSAEKRAAGWRAFLEANPRGIFVSRDKENLTGWIAIGPSRDGVADAGEILALYVDPPFWRQGAGKRLLEAAEAELWARGHRSCLLWVLERNLVARAFYRHQGYADDGLEKTERFDDVELVETRMRKARPRQGAD